MIKQGAVFSGRKYCHTVLVYFKIPYHSQIILMPSFIYIHDCILFIFSIQMLKKSGKVNNSFIRYWPIFIPHHRHFSLMLWRVEETIICYCMPIEHFAHNPMELYFIIF